MAHEFDDLIADLESAKADLARSVRRCRTRLDKRVAEAPQEEGAAARLFDWERRPDR